MTDDAMVPIARILGRGEALTVAAMLDAAGIIVHLGGECFSLALFTLPVNPQGRGDYYLTTAAAD